MRKSVVYNIDDDSFRNLVERAGSYCDIVKFFGLSINGSGGFKVVKRRIASLKIDCSHIVRSIDRQRKMHTFANQPKRETKDITVKASVCVNTHHLKRRLLREGILNNKCYICGINEWNSKELSLHLDHINGDRQDNRLENLRLLCPNCHSQTPTYAGKKNKNMLREKYNCKNCGCGITKQSRNSLCVKCLGIANRKVKDRPSKEELEKMVWKEPTLKVAKRYGVSDKAIEKWCKSYGIAKPPRGYWMKVESGKLEGNNSVAF